MQNLTSPKTIIELLRKNKLIISKKFGQNFLVDKNVLDKILSAADLTPEDLVLEIGAGMGTLTVELAKRAKKVVSIEIDKKLIPVLTETLEAHENVSLINDDVLKIDLREIVDDHFGDRDFKVVANVPYYISTPIIMLFSESNLRLTKMVLLLQKEVAQRIVARPGGKDYGILSLAVQYRMMPEIIDHVPPTVFLPPPKVESAIIMLERRLHPQVLVKDEKILFELIKAGFAQRRKRILNAFAARFPLDKTKQEILSILDLAGIDPNRRGETLTIEEYARVADIIMK